MTLLDWIDRTKPRTIDLEDAAQALGTSDLVRAFWATVVLSESDHPILDREIAVVPRTGSDLDGDRTRIRMNFGVRLVDGDRQAA